MSFQLAMALTGPAQQGSGSAASGLGMLVPFIAIFLIFYVLIIRPQNKERRKHQEILDNLKSGDRVVTAGGILGTIQSVSDTSVELKVGEKMKVTVLRSSIRGLQDSELKQPSE
ncbi:preprotein translocase subunit YajC [bacterium]|nr:preprotein translocase subunit YajC [candidate division CSSED10-310 bacterium]